MAERYRELGDHGDGDLCIANPPLPEPTDAPIRSEEKLLILQRRASLRQSLWNPADSRRWLKPDQFTAIK